MKKLINWLIPIILGLAIWFVPTPEGLTPQSWHLFAIFVATIAGFITQPLPIGGVSIIVITVAALTGTLKISEGLSGFSDTSIWLIVGAFLFSRGFIKTGLGKRIAYNLISAFGSSSLRLAYALALSDLILAPATPSNTARVGGVIMPITTSLAKAFGSEPQNGPRKIGSFLMQSIYQVNTVTSAMFQTSMAGNTLVAALALQSFGIGITWGDWAMAAIVPGLIALLIMPYFIYKAYPPEIKDAREAQQMIRQELKELGSMSFQEWVMLGVFILALVLWATSQFTQLHATVVAFIGISILLATGVLIWDDVKSEKGAWDTLVWMGTLMAFAGFLSKLGFIKWATVLVGGYIPEGSWVIAFIVAVVVNTYAHYVFASLTAHISAMFVAFSAIAISAGAPPMLTLLMIAFTSNLCMSLTHYAAGPSPVIFNTGYVPQNTWWKLGFFTSVINLIIFIGIGSAWMKLIGMW
ncbi:anion permease [Veillonella denticariosi JCM 15641]|uniref:Anion permease n=1 Tax=Veillonella denticariosi JCM 15641 TaxID=1298594 RepID=A0A2S7Z6L7_9FIRM|nr:anion permease [Veillonella denticariosi]PQL18948.1 anion permease [Veillonella denticariosi JCM 15641]